MKKYLLLGVAMVAIISLAGCDLEQQNPPNTYQNESQKSEAIQQNLIKSTPLPKITNSEERVNVAKRATIFNDQNKISYIYLMNYGKIMAFYTVKGKVSSLRSYMSPMEKLVDADGNNCVKNYSGQGMYEPCYTVEAPDIDGTYGENIHGIFFFTTEGAYVEWNGEYMMSDQALALTDKPALVREVK